MSDKTFSFKKQLEWGNKQEEEFLKHYPLKCVKSEDRRWDYTTIVGSKKIELKTDSYDKNKTANFFMERYSDLYKKTPGGPWRAAQDGIDVFIYWFPKNNIWYEFHDLPALIKVLDELTEKMFIMRIKNPAWTTGGFKVPRDLLINLYKRHEY